MSNKDCYDFALHCECNSLEHVIQFSVIEDDLYIQAFKHNFEPFFRRLVCATIYTLFDKQPRYGLFDCTMLRTKDMSLILNIEGTSQYSSIDPKPVSIDDDKGRYRLTFRHGMSPEGPEMSACVGYTPGKGCLQRAARALVYLSGVRRLEGLGFVVDDNARMGLQALAYRQLIEDTPPLED